MKSVRRTAWGVPALLLLLPALASAATITVNSTSDADANDGLCTLREAIDSANQNTASGAEVGECGAGQAPLVVDVIAFSVAGTIIPASPFPSIIEPVVINGFTAPGASANTLAVGNDSVHVVEINGTNAGLGMSGFTVTATGGGTTIQGLVINRFVQDGSGNGGHGIHLLGSSGNTITGNFIGTNTAGTAALANQGIAVRALAGSNNNLIGGTTPASRNVLSGNDVGVQFGNSSNGNVVRGNYIGVNASGTAAIANLIGVQISGSESNSIGGPTAAARNILSGNTVSGIDITNGGATNNLIQGNFIGTDVTGALPIGNGADGGIRITDGFSGPAVNNQIGGTPPGEGNVIAFNTGDGVSITALSGFTNTGISILGNSIHSNGGLGIDLGDNGVTPNDTDDPDIGHNGLQNFPVITSVIPGIGVTTINGTLNSNVLTLFRLQFFSNTACDASGNGEGQTYLGDPTPLIITTQMGPTVAFSVTVPTVVSPGAIITGTATDIGLFDKRGVKTGIRPMGLGVVFGETSEFSACFVVGATPTPTPTSTPLKVTSTPTSTPSNTPTQTPSNTPTTTFTPTSGPSPTPTLTPSNTPTQTPSNTPSFTPTTTFTPTEGPSPTPTLTPSTTPSNTPSFTPTTTFTPTEGSSPTPTLTPSNTPIVVETLTPTPTLTPSSTPTVPVGATATPTATPTTVPPSATPTLVGGGGGPPGSIPVPTLSEWMLALLAMALAGAGFFLIRRA